MKYIPVPMGMYVYDVQAESRELCVLCESKESSKWVTSEGEVGGDDEQEEGG
jgi:hypothetical protein